jgi:predicted outer membrane protein
MQSRRALLLAALASPALFAGRRAAGQANLRPDPTPRLPPQPGQGLPPEERQFLRRASRLSAAQEEAGRIVAEKASSEDVRQLARSVAEDHASLGRAIAAFAGKHSVDLKGGEAPEPPDASLAALRGASGEDAERRFLSRQLALYTPLAELYQTEASNSPDKELGRIAIEALASLRARFETARQIGQRYKLSVDTVENPPQY